MERVLKWSLPALIVVNIALVWSGVLEAGTAILVGATIELLVASIAIRQVVVAIRTALSNPQLSPQDAMAAIAVTVEQSLPKATSHSLRPKLELLLQHLLGEAPPLLSDLAAG